jgi:hypothetical protein
MKIVPIDSLGEAEIAHSMSSNFVIKPSGYGEIWVDGRKRTHPDAKPNKASNAIQSDYFYERDKIKGLPHLRKVQWHGRVSRDALPVASRASSQLMRKSGQPSQQLSQGDL